MSQKRTILIQIDSDPHPSVFDRVVAVDAGAEEVLSYGGVKPEDVRDIVHGAIFTRGAKDLNRTAIFIGGKDVKAGERLLEEARRHMLPQFGLRVSALLDANGANTTAAAVVRAAQRHLDLSNCRVLTLEGTGPVGQRVARLLARRGAEVCVASTQGSWADAVCAAVRGLIPDARIAPAVTATPAELEAALRGKTLVVAAGAAGTVVLPLESRRASADLKVAIDLNAVPPAGIEGIAVSDKGTSRDDVIAYGAIGIGEAKMKIHKAAVARLFERNDQVLDAEEILALAESVDG